LDHVHAQLEDDVLVVPGQLRVLFDAKHDVQVAGLPAAQPCLTLPADADLRAGVDAGGDLDREPPRLLDAPLAAALRARVLQQPAGASTRRAGRTRDHLAEDRLGGPANLPCAAATRAGVSARPVLGPTLR